MKMVYKKKSILKKKAEKRRERKEQKRYEPYRKQTTKEMADINPTRLKNHKCYRT